jgi:hypothetical protein
VGRRWGRFIDLEVADAVLALVGSRAALLEWLAAADPTVCCQRCQREAPIASTALSLVAQTTTGDPAAPGFVRLSFAHAGCLPSMVVVDPTLAGRHIHPDRGVDAVAARALRAAPPFAAVLWEATGGRAFYEPTGGWEARDVLVSGLLQRGWELLTRDPLTVPLRLLPGWRLVTAGERLALFDPDGQPPLTDVVVPSLAGWWDAIRAEGCCGLITGTGLGLGAGPDAPGLLAAIRAGRVVGAAAAVVDT